MANMVASLTPITKDRETNNKRTDTKNMPNLEWRKMSERRQKKKDGTEMRKE
jgi:hypothetical protein